MNIKTIGTNVIEVGTGKALVLFSYDTLVACCYDGRWCRIEKSYGPTTSRHINRWLESYEVDDADKVSAKFLEELVA